MKDYTLFIFLYVLIILTMIAHPLLKYCFVLEEQTIFYILSPFFLIISILLFVGFIVAKRENKIGIGNAILNIQKNTFKIKKDSLKE